MEKRKSIDLKSPTIIMSDYQKAKQHYKLTGKSLEDAAKKMKWNTYEKQGKKYVKIPPTSKEFRDKFENFIIKKWKTDTQEYIGTYSMSYKVYDTKKRKQVDRITKITAIGTKKSVLANAVRTYEARVQRYMEDYPENDSYAFNPDADSLIPVKSGDGIRVEEQRVESSVRGGQRIIGMKGNKRHMRMKDAFSFFKFSKDTDYEWDLKQGTCVFDYLYHRFKDTEGCSKFFNGTKTKPRTREEVYRDLNIILGRDDGSIGVVNPLTDGVSVNMLENFCEEFGINMYAYDKDDSCIQVYKVKNPKKKGNNLYFYVYDGHFYPEEDVSNQKSMSAKNADNKGMGVSYKSNEIEDPTFSKEAVKKIVIAPTEEEFEAIKETTADYLSVQNKWALQYIKNNNAEIPFPINNRNIQIEEATIQKLEYEDKIVMTRPINPYVKKFYDYWTTNGFQGESPANVMRYIWENRYGFQLGKAPFNSNIGLLNDLLADNVKWRTHLGRTTDKYSPEEIRNMLRNGKAKVFDISKCYSDCIYNQREPFIVFKGKERIEKYDGEPLTLGLYFVETDDMTLFHQSNWYSRKIIELAEKEGIDFKIVRQLRCVDEEWNWSKEIPAENEEDEPRIITLSNDKLFKDWCDEVIEMTIFDEDPTLCKIVMNSLTGYLARTMDRKKEVSLFKNLDELWYDFVLPDAEENPSMNMYMNTIIDGEDKIYLYGDEKVSKHLSSGLPMYIQILDWSNMALYQLGKDVGGEIVYRKTDCLISVGGEMPEDYNAYYEYYTDSFGKYRYEDTEKALHFNLELAMNNNRKVETPELENDWKDWDYNDSGDWKFILETAIKEGGMLISGRAGTGKTYIIHKGIEEGLLPEEDETRMAPTNRAARNIKGKTIHYNMKMNKNGNTNNKSLIHLAKYNAYIIDEISMLTAELWGKLLLLKKKNPTATFILLGDHRQCPPIESGKEIDYFNHPYAKKLVNYNRCELTKPQRYDMKLWNFLEKFYNYGVDDESICKKKLTIENILYRKNIVFTHKTRKMINNRCMEYVSKDKTAKIVLKVPEKCSNKYADDVILYVGLPVMAKVNCRDDNVINSDEFVIKELRPNESIIVLERDENKEDLLEVEFKEFHNNFVANYAATTHSSQGVTIVGGLNIWDWFMMIDNPKVGYTAVSRAKKCDDIWIATGVK